MMELWPLIGKIYKRSTQSQLLYEKRKAGGGGGGTKKQWKDEALR